MFHLARRKYLTPCLTAYYFTDAGKVYRLFAHLARKANKKGYEDTFRKKSIPDAAGWHNKENVPFPHLHRRT